MWFRKGLTQEIRRQPGFRCHQRLLAAGGRGDIIELLNGTARARSSRLCGGEPYQDRNRKGHARAALQNHFAS
jgi:hypothetical protein